MGALRRLLAMLVFLLATLLALVAAILCVTLILLPLGLPLMGGALRMYGYGMKLMLPRNPLPKASDVGDSAKHSWRRTKKAGSKGAKNMRKRFGW